MAEELTKHRNSDITDTLTVREYMTSAQDAEAETSNHPAVPTTARKVGIVTNLGCLVFWGLIATLGFAFFSGLFFS